MQVSPALVMLAVVVVCPGYGSNKDSCLRYGGGSCCSLLNGIGKKVKEVIEDQPFYIVLLPRNEDTSNIDNICLTFFPLPDDSNTYLTYQSRVNKDGSNKIESYVVSNPEAGVLRSGNGLCQFTDTLFAQLKCENEVFLNQRCHTFGDCVSEDFFDASSGVFGFSEVCSPLSKSCANMAEATVRNNGLPEEDFYILPMRLPSKCVLNQVCTVAPAVQRFCQTVGVTFPAINNCADPELQNNFG